MPTKTRMLEYGGFVHSPDVPESAEFSEYLRQIDPLLAARQNAVDRWSESTVSADLLNHKRDTQQALDAFIAKYGNQYNTKQVERNPAFLPVHRFFDRYRPLRQPFSILHCNLDLPLHTVYRFEHDYDVAMVNAALDKVTPLRWWQNGPSNHPCYLFGELIWELKATEVDASYKGLTLLFENTKEQDKQQRDRLQHNLANPSGPSGEQYVPEGVRAIVWRREGGRCARCHGHEGLDYSVVNPVVHGNTATSQNVQLLCVKCRAKL
jgi:hypothetical protein